MPEAFVHLDHYRECVGQGVLDHLRQLAESLRGLKVVHVNSTRTGGGVAEILHRLIPLKKDLGIEASWEIIHGSPEFYECTKGFHNALQGSPTSLPERLLQVYEKTNEENAEKLRGNLQDADVVFIHDPQPAALLGHIPERKGKWIWRCHIDVSQPQRAVWKFLRGHVNGYDASIFSLPAFAQPLPHPQYLIAPSIDPLSEKNVELTHEEIRSTCQSHGIDPDRPILLQVSRFDRFKDPVGVIEAYRLAKVFAPQLQLVLAGGAADDDPEGVAVLEEVRTAVGDEKDIHLLLLPSDAHRTINALQRAATIVVQKSLKEGFGLTVTEALWKGRPVLGGDTGGIRLQVVNHHTGFLVNTPQGVALRARYLLNHPEKIEAMGAKAREFVRENFLITRHLREYLTMMVALVRGADGKIELQ